jgi:hypothetical protein
VAPRVAAAGGLRAVLAAAETHAESSPEVAEVAGFAVGNIVTCPEAVLAALAASGPAAATADVAEVCVRALAEAAQEGSEARAALRAAGATRAAQEAAQRHPDAPAVAHWAKQVAAALERRSAAQ